VVIAYPVSQSQKFEQGDSTPPILGHHSSIKESWVLMMPEIEFRTGEEARNYLNKECGVQKVVLQKLSAEEAKAIAQTVNEKAEMIKLLQACAEHSRRLGETNQRLNRENFGLGMKLSKFAQNNLPTFVKIAGTAMELFAGLAVQEHNRAQSIQAQSVELFTEITDEADVQISSSQRRINQLDSQYEQLRAENQRLMVENQQLRAKLGG
jgi:hypothetical protein